MIQIRKCVFETNSSSTHSITIYNEEDYTKIRNGEGYIYAWGDGIEGTVLDKTQVIEGIRSQCSRYSISAINPFKWTKEDIEELLNMDEKDFCNYVKKFGYYPSDFYNEYLETDWNEYKLPTGETLHIRCEYGHD